jgi:hypothetical protein
MKVWLGKAVSLFASAGLRDGDGVILIMSADHCESITLRLQLEGISAEAYERSGQLICVTAEDLLAKFIPDGVLDEGLFKATIARLIETARASASHGDPVRVRVFGEMVSQLRNRDLEVTTRLEELWDQVIADHSVSLLCTYALGDAGDHLPEGLIQLHSESIERESTLAQDA